MKPLILTWAVFGSLLLSGCQNTAEGMKQDAKINSEKASEQAEVAKEKMGVVSQDMSKKAEQTGEDLSAATLTPRIKAAIISNPMLNHEGNLIDVDSVPDKVVLKGHVKTAAMKEEAGRVAKGILENNRSKATLQNNLTIQG